MWRRRSDRGGGGDAARQGRKGRHDEALVHGSRPLEFRGEGGRGDQGERAAGRSRGRDRGSPRADRRGHGAASRQEGADRAPLHAGLRPREDADERPGLPSGDGDEPGDRLPRPDGQADAASRSRGGASARRGPRRGRASAARHHLRDRRAGQGHRRSVRELRGPGRGSGRGQRAPEGERVDLRPGHPGRAGIRAGAEDRLSVARGRRDGRARRTGPRFGGPGGARPASGGEREEAAMAKKVIGHLKLQVAAGKANPSPPIGPALGQRGINIMEFCKAFNAQTQDMEPGLPIPTVITVYSDRSFTFITKTPPAPVLLKKAAGIKSGSGRPNTDKVGTVTRDQLEEIVRTKEPDLTAADMDAAVRTIAGTARSMGLNVEGL